MINLRRTEKLYNLNMTVMAAPGILFFLIFSYLPMLGIIVAFKSYNFRDGIFLSPWIGLKNFEFFFNSMYASRITFNTLFLNAIFIITGTILQLAFAIMLNEVNNKYFSKLTQSLMFLPYFTSWVIVGYFSYAMLSMDYGIINRLLVSVGLSQVEWYNRPEYWPLILTIVSNWKTTGYGSVVFLAGISGINYEYYEAAYVDGASRLTQIRKITLPLLRPLITILTLLALGKIFYSDFGMFYNLTRNSGALLSTTDVLDTYVFRALKVKADFGMSSAAGLYQSLVGFVLVLAANAVVKKINSEDALF